MTIIQPSIGRIVLFLPPIDGGRHQDGQPFGALVAGVNDDATINLLVAARDGTPYGVQNVVLVQDGDEIDLDKAHAFWMAYQKGQAAKTEAIGAPLHERVGALETQLKGNFESLGTWLAQEFARIEQRISGSPEVTGLAPPAPPPMDPAPIPAAEQQPAPEQKPEASTTESQAAPQPV